MRDMERIKPRYSVTLDNKQVVMIVVSSVVILTLVFAIGFVLGRGLGSRGGRQAGGPPQQGTQQNAVVFTEQTTAQAAGEGYGQQGQVNSPTATTQSATAVMPPTTTAHKHSELTFYKSLTRESSARKRVQKKRTEKTAPRKIARRPGGRFSIQCGAFREKSQAERLGTELRKKYRLNPWTESVTVKGVRWYRVRIGHFATSERAKAYEAHQLAPKGLRNCGVAIEQ